MIRLLEESLLCSGNVVYECGVYKGASAIHIASALKNSQKKCIFRLFDTFAGVPTANLKYDNVYTGGEFSDTSIELVKEVLQDYNFIDYNVGFIPETFKHKNDSIIFAHLDLDIYQSHKDALEFIFPRLVKDGIIVFDDYKSPECKGAKIAIDNFLKDNEKKLIFVEEQNVARRAHLRKIS